MADVIKGNFGSQRRGARGWAKYEAQESDEGGQPDIKRPPDEEVPEAGDEGPPIPDAPTFPPFTGEDVEDVGRPQKKDDPKSM